ncbi:hypothetical protein A3Q56_01260, partial [Intoshia linei]
MEKFARKDSSLYTPSEWMSINNQLSDNTNFVREQSFVVRQNAASIISDTSHNVYHNEVKSTQFLLDRVL